MSERVSVSPRTQTRTAISCMVGQPAGGHTAATHSEVNGDKKYFSRPTLFPFASILFISFRLCSLTHIFDGMVGRTSAVAVRTALTMIAVSASPPKPSSPHAISCVRGSSSMVYHSIRSSSGSDVVLKLCCE